MVCGCHFSEHRTITPAGRPRSHLLVDVLPPYTHLCSRITRTVLTPDEKAALTFASKGHETTNDEGGAHIQQSRPSSTPVPAQEPLRPAYSLAGGTTTLTLTWMVCTQLAAPIPAQELTKTTIFPPTRRPRSHFTPPPLCSDRTRIAPSPLKNLDSSRVVGNLQDGERVRLHSEHPFPLKNLDSS